jgi:nucleotide-binding universal stress UspA family protein/CBS domain-containing protein
MANFAQILVAADYSECSDEALRLGARLAHAFRGRLLVLHLVPLEIPGLFGELSAVALVDAQRITRETDRLRKHVGTVLEGSDAMPPVEVEVQWGSPHLDLVPYAVNRRVDLIVLGTHGRSGLKHVLLGSVAERAVRTAPCPVLTVRTGAAGRVGKLRPATRVARGESGALRLSEVGSVMHRAITVRPDDLLSVARDQMASASVRHIPVVDGGRLVGMLADRDLAAHVGQLDRTRVNAAMTPDPITVSRDVTIDTAARMMIDRGVRALPVVDGEEIIGIISTSDILEDYARAARG